MVDFRVTFRKDTKGELAPRCTAAHPQHWGGLGTRRSEAGSTGDQDACSMKVLPAHRWVGIACALATVGSARLAAQETRYDSSVVAVRGSGPGTFVLITGMVGGVGGFRRLASLL